MERERDPRPSRPVASTNFAGPAAAVAGGVVGGVVDGVGGDVGAVVVAEGRVVVVAAARRDDRAERGECAGLQEMLVA